jgi:hypothetical protein
MTIFPSRARAGWAAAGLVGAGLALGLVVSQLGIATAGSPTPQPSGSTDTDRPFEHRFGMPGLMPGGPMPGGRVLHGQATVQTPDGTEVVSTQTGTVTSIDGSAVAVRSSDGFTRSYLVDAATLICTDGDDGALSSLKSGDRVHVTAVQDGGSWHARWVASGDMSRPFLDRGHMMRDRMMRGSTMYHGSAA